LSDEIEGHGGYKVLSDPEYLKFFGYGTLAEKPAAKKSSDAPAEAPIPPVEAPTTAAVPPAAVELQNGV
jgi:hypothetical protein